MYLTLCDGAGKRLEAIVLAAGPRHIRAVFRGQTDTVELELAGSCWLSESGDCYEIDCALPFTTLEGAVPAAKATYAGGR